MIEMVRKEMKGRTLKLINASFQSRVSSQDDYGYHQDEKIDTAEQGKTDKHAHRLDVDRGPGHQLTGLRAVMEGIAEPLEMVIELVAQVIGYFLGKELRQVALPVAEQAPRETGPSDAKCRQHQCPMSGSSSAPGR